MDNPDFFHRRIQHKIGRRMSPTVKRRIPLPYHALLRNSNGKRNPRINPHFARFGVTRKPAELTTGTIATGLFRHAFAKSNPETRAALTVPSTPARTQGSRPAGSPTDKIQEIRSISRFRILQCAQHQPMTLTKIRRFQVRVLN